MEIRRRGIEPIFSATPPLEALRILVRMTAAEDPNGQKDGLRLYIADVSRAHFYAKAKREVYIELPREDERCKDPDAIGRLERTMYGTLDAAQEWALDYSEKLLARGYIQGRASPCHFFHPVHQTALLVHGDDFIAVGRSQGRHHLKATLEEFYEIKDKTLGPDHGQLQQIRVLGRVISWESWGLQLEGDPAHLELGIEQLGLNDCKSVSTPGEAEDCGVPAIEVTARRRAADREATRWEVQEEEDKALDSNRGKVYASISARFNYLAQDRPDIAFPAKELMRRLSHPDEADERKLKRVARYLHGQRRMVAQYPWQPLDDELRVYVDANHAGCIRTRLSTVGGATTWGGGFIKGWSKTVHTLCLSSGESELAAVVRGGTESLGTQAVLEDFGRKVRIKMVSDATAAIGMAKRQGLGRVRHLAVADLWIQQRIQKGDIAVAKIDGRQNPADAYTKVLSNDHCQYLLRKLGYVFIEGRPAAAPLRTEKADEGDDCGL